MKTVGVIGCGPAGLAAVKELKQAGLDVTAFEKKSSVGGVWALDPNYPSGTWDGLTMNVNRHLLEYSDFPWRPDKYEGREKAHHGIFPHCTETKAYLQDYANHFDLMPHIRMNTEITNIEKVAEGGWIIEASTKGGKALSHTFDAIVLCTGIAGPADTTLQDSDMFQGYEGEKIHSKDFMSLEQCKGKRVLVVGGAVTGSELPPLLARSGLCKSVTTAVRNMPYHTHVFSHQKPHKPYDDLICTRLPTWFIKTLPSKVSSEGLKKAILDDWPEQATVEKCGAAPNDDIRDCMFYPAKYWWQEVEAGNLTVKPAVSSASGNTVSFVDGTSDDFDMVIFATGYKLDVSYLPQSVQDVVTFTNPITNKPDLALYKMTLAPAMRDIAFCGYIYNYGPHFPVGEMQARLVAAIFSGKLPFPDDKTVTKAVEKLKAYRSECLLNKGVIPTMLCDDIGNDLGVKPSILKCLWNPSKFLTAPAYACVYRMNPAVDGPEMAQKANVRLDELLANPLSAAEI